MQKEVIGNATLYCADCSDVLPELEKFDLCLTDPPYGIGNFVQVSGRIRGRAGNTGREVEWNNSKPDQSIFEQIKHISRHRIIFGANHFNCFEDKGGAIIWDKNQKMPNFSKCEIASCTHYKKTEIVRIPWTNFIVKHKAQTGHPNERPVELYEWCIDYLPIKKFESVIDPFMGSGSTAVAAINKGKRYVGIEREQEYFDTACERIEETQRQEILI